MSVTFHVRQVPALEIVNRRKKPKQGLRVARREIHHWVAMIVFLEVISGTAKTEEKPHVQGTRVCASGGLCKTLPFSSTLWSFKQQHFRGSWAAIRKAVEGKPHPLGLLCLLMHVSPKALRCRKERSFLLAGRVKGVALTQSISCVLCMEEVNKLYNLRSPLAKLGCCVLNCDSDCCKIRPTESANISIYFTQLPHWSPM